MKPLYIISAIALLLAGCSHSKGPVFDRADLKGGNLVIYRPSRAGTGALHDYQVKVGNKETCLLHNGAFFVTNISQPTKVEVTTSVAMDSTKETIDKGFVLVGPKKRGLNFAGAAFGAIGEAIAESQESNGIYEIKQMEPEIAKAYIAKVRMRKDCAVSSPSV